MNSKSESLPYLDTQRLILRPMLASDSRFIVHWRNAHHVVEMCKQTSLASLTEENHLKWFFESRDQRVDYLILEKEAHEPIGSVSFTWVNLEGSQKCGELGKYIGETSALGKGFAFEATQRWINFGFNELRLNYIIARTRSKNAANIKINRKLGFEIKPFPSKLRLPESEWLFMCLDRSSYIQQTV